MNLSSKQKNTLYYLYLWDLIFEAPRAAIYLEEGYFIEDFESLVSLGLANKSILFNVQDLGEQKEEMIEKLVGLEELGRLDVEKLKNANEIYGYSLTAAGKQKANKEIPLARKIDALALKPKAKLQQNKTKSLIEEKLKSGL